MLVASSYVGRTTQTGPLPDWLVEVTRVPGLGAKTARRLFEELGVASLEDLKEAAEAHRIRDLKGLGEKLEENVLAGLVRIDEAGEATGRVLLSTARPIAEELAQVLREHPAADRGEGAGAGRRWAHTRKDIDLIATANEPQAPAGHLLASPLISVS